ncbi:MAG: BrnT family toxin [Cyanobacteria bacterium P01_E01_bin.42]
MEKLDRKHGVFPEEVIEVFARFPIIKFVEKGDRENEDVYSAYGRTNSGRYLIVFFIYKLDRNALILSARDMTDGERKRYQKKSSS